MIPEPCEREIFLNALELSNASERRQYLKECCGDNVVLRKSVESLLSASVQSDNPLDRSPAAVATATAAAADWMPETFSETHPDLIGTTIGPYRLMEQIGEGGFGLVYVAQQEHPVRRQVALKIVKPGTGSKEVLSRFEAERQAVAMMDHPNIAVVFDAGVTADARPYFAMELVRGVPVTRFADAHRLTIRDRLNLFCDVCAAVQHAHQKGVIHRDIKPSNVMVTLHDDKPVVKVIDFGVAKAIGQTLSEGTIYTKFFSMIGTPLYMSPEQAEMSGLDVDTRSDIFSLGVMLYELLAGTTPFDRDRLDSAGLDEMRRIICEEEPPRPSRRLTTLGDRMTTVSASRQMDLARLGTSLQGDLDWIVMRSLEKDRNRRYDSAAAMSADVQRYLKEQPIEARPPSWHYLLRKFARRNRTALATGGLITLTLLVGLAASLWQMGNAINERNEKELALREIEAFANNITQAHALIANAQTHVDSDQSQLAIENFDNAVTQQPTYYLPWVIRGQFYTRLGKWDQAADDYSQALRLRPPIDTAQWWGVPALLLLTEHDQDYQILMQRIQQRFADGRPIADWEMLRNGLASDNGLPPRTYDQITNLAERWLAEMGDVDRRFPPRQDSFLGDAGHRFPPPENAARSRDVNDRPGKRGSRHHLPNPLCQYITGLANLRAGRIPTAIKRLSEATSQAWPGDDLVHAPLAIAYLKSHRIQDALASLERSQQAFQEPDTETRQEWGGDRERPWFDTVEGWLLHREATRLMNSRQQ